MKVDHIVELLGKAQREAPQSVFEAGCGDGAVLAELGRRAIARRRVGLEVSRRACAIAAQRPEISEVRVYDGRAIPFATGEFDLGIATHVLEHVNDPTLLLSELARVARLIVVEVPLERNLAARRGSARALASAAGHIQTFAARDIRRLVADAGLTSLAELCDPLPRAVHTFRGGPLLGTLKWSLRASLAIWPALGRRLMTMHYAVLAEPARTRSYTS